MRRHATLVMIVALAAMTMIAGAGRAAPPPAVPDAPADENRPREYWWAVRLGHVVFRMKRSVPTVDRVVLVPDTATYLDELNRWSPRGRWPVLFEDDHLAPMFVRRFRPAEVIRRDPVSPPEAMDDASLRAALDALVVRAWGGDPEKSTARALFNRLGHPPAGVVITSASDPAWTAAAALAAGRGQPLAWLEDELGGPNAILAAPRASALRAQVEALVAATGYPHEGLGGGIDTLTICRSLPGSMYVNLPPARQLRPVGAPERPEPRAMTDILGRDATFERFAFAGWIFGDEVRCTYVAMCSLFSPRDRAWLVNTYSRQGAFAAYDMAEAEATLRGALYELEPVDGRTTTLDGWRRRIMRPVTADLVFVNTKGNVDFFDLASGRARTTDVPMLETPAVVQFIHSWSFRRPQDAGTIGATWLDHGAYAYVGSVHEPQLLAFVPPALVARRVAAGVPMLVAARWWPGEGPFSWPWKVNTWGDPLMLCDGPGRPGAPRIDPTPREHASLGDDAAALMRQCEADETGEVFARAVRTLVLLGRDDVASGLWRAADQRGAGAPAARAALGPLFRQGDGAGFLRAWDQLLARDRRAVDMLWLLELPRLEGSPDEEALLRLQSAIRPEMAHVDVELLLPHLRRRFGEGHVRALVQREIERADSTRVRRGLERLDGRK